MTDKSEQTKETDGPTKAVETNKADSDTGIEKAKDADPPGDEAKSDCTNRQLGIIAAIVVVIVIIVLLVIFVPRKDDEPEEEYTPSAIDYQTGVSLVTSYDVTSVVTSRLARTTIFVTVANALSCSSIRSISLRLPSKARISSLQTIASMDDESDENGETGVCVTYGDVQRLQEARENFLETASEGLPGAYIEQQNEFLHSLQVAIPPLGTSKVVFQIEELLQQRLGKVELELPFAPNEDIDKISFDLQLVATTNNLTASGLELELGQDLQLAAELYVGPNSTDMIATTGRFAIDIPDAHDFDALPKILRGSFVPFELPQGGILQVDQNDDCFEMQFLPPDLEPLPRNVLFVVDVSSSSTIQPTKDALKDFVRTSLSTGDQLSIQLFGGSGTEDLHRSASMNEREVEDTINFIDSEWRARQPGQRNLHEAFLQGLLRAKSDMEDGDESTVTLLVLLSAGWANVGETDRGRIVDDIYNLNFESETKPVKIFSLALESADQELLNAIAVMNGGVSGRVVKSSEVAYDIQMKNFFESEFGTVLLSDVNTVFDTGLKDVATIGETQNAFPLLSDGYEIVIRGLLPPELDNVQLSATTVANTNTGSSTWTTNAIKATRALEPKASSDQSGICYQSYAHARISQLLRLRDVANLVGDETLQKVAKLTEPCNLEGDDGSTIAECIEEEAIRLALSAGVVVEGLTSMVTVDEDDCLSFEGETEICVAGTNGEGVVFEGVPVGEDSGGSDYSGYDGFPAYAPSSAPSDSHSFSFSLIHWTSLFVLLVAFIVKI